MIDYNTEIHSKFYLRITRTVTIEKCKSKIVPSKLNLKVILMHFSNGGVIASCVIWQMPDDLNHKEAVLPHPLTLCVLPLKS